MSAPNRAAEVITAPSAYISLAEPHAAAGAGKAEVRVGHRVAAYPELSLRTSIVRSDVSSHDRPFMAATYRHVYTHVPGHQFALEKKISSAPGGDKAALVYRVTGDEMGRAFALQGLTTPRGVCMDKAGAATAVLQPATPDIIDARP